MPDGIEVIILKKNRTIKEINKTIEKSHTVKNKIFYCCLCISGMKGMN